MPTRSTASGTTRPTKQRRAVAELLEEQSRFQSAQQIHAALRDRGHAVGLATVYRNLAIMAETGVVDTLVGDDGETAYRRCGAAHHHHLVCRRCGRAVEVSGPAVERWSQAVAREHGFTEVSHRLELFGVCQQCRETGPPS